MMFFMDGFDYLTGANLNLKWDSSPGWGLTPGAYGKAEGINPGNGSNLPHTLSSNYATGMCGFHIYVNNINSVTVVHSWYDGSNLQVDLRMDTTGAFYFTRNGTTIGTTSSIRVRSNGTYWLEAQVIIHPSLGQANLYIGTVSVLAQTGLNTQADSNAYFNKVQLTGNNGQFQFYDNYHFWDPSAGDVSGFPYGEHIIDTKLPSATGSNSQWNKGGTVINTYNYQQVNEANEDGDTTYVYMGASGSGDIDLYGFSPLTESAGTIGTVAINTIARIDDAGPDAYTIRVLSNGSAGNSTSISPTAGYLNYQVFDYQDPHTGVAWTIAGFNAAQFGYKKS